MTTREIVLDMLLKEEEGSSFSHEILNDTLMKCQYLPKNQRAFLTRLFKGVVERRMELDRIIDQFAKVKTQKQKPVIRNLLRMGVYQMLYMDGVKDFAAVNEMVALARKRKLASLSGFVNAVLRNILRGADQIIYPDPEKDKPAWLSARYSYPEWIVKLWSSRYGVETAEKMMAASLEEHGFSVRCNTAAVGPETLVEELREEGVRLEAGKFLPYAFTIQEVDYLGKLASFQKGHFIVQDESSMLVAHCAGIKKGDHVLDLCAAPGGKATHAAQILMQLEDKKQPDQGEKELPAGTGFVMARDISDYKINRILENKERLGLAYLFTERQDALEIREDSVNAYDVVFADLPCSGLGVTGKKSDIKYHTQEKDCEELARLQRKMLAAASGYVKPGGTLIYSTCTVSPAENEENADWFAGHYPFEPVSLAEFLPEKLKAAEEVTGRVQLLQGIHGTDGFFIAKFKKAE